MYTAEKVLIGGKGGVRRLELGGDAPIAIQTMWKQPLSEDTLQETARKIAEMLGDNNKIVQSAVAAFDQFTEETKRQISESHVVINSIESIIAAVTEMGKGTQTAMQTAALMVETANKRPDRYRIGRDCGTAYFGYRICKFFNLHQCSDTVIYGRYSSYKSCFGIRRGNRYEKPENCRQHQYLSPQGIRPRAHSVA